MNEILLPDARLYDDGHELEITESLKEDGQRYKRSLLRSRNSGFTCWTCRPRISLSWAENQVTDFSPWREIQSWQSHWPRHSLMPAHFPPAGLLAIAEKVVSDAPLTPRGIVIGLPKVVPVHGLIEGVSTHQQFVSPVISQTAERHGHIAYPARNLACGPVFPINCDGQWAASVHSSLACAELQRVPCRFTVDQAPGVSVF